jgi:2'-5' RNA ligase
MPYAITLRLDSPSALAIETMWHILDEAGFDAKGPRIAYPPHVTLAIFPDDTPEEPLVACVEWCSAEWTALPFNLSGFGVFPGPSPILWAAPVVTAALLARHAEVHAALPGLDADAHYRPGAWVPHITLTTTANDPGAAIFALLSSWQPVSGLLDRLDLVRFPPVAVVRSHALTAPP